MASVVGEFLSGVDMKEAASYPHHHEDKPNTQVHRPVIQKLNFL